MNTLRAIGAATAHAWAVGRYVCHWLYREARTPWSWVGLAHDVLLLPVVAFVCLLGWCFGPRHNTSTTLRHSARSIVTVLVHGSGVTGWQWWVAQLAFMRDWPTPVRIAHLPATDPVSGAPLDLMESAHVLAQQLRDWRGQVADTSSPESVTWVLVGHSMGGLAAAHVAAHDWIPEPQHDCAIVVTLGSPWLGAPVLRWPGCRWPDAVAHPRLHDMQVNSQFLQQLHTKLAHRASRQQQQPRPAYHCIGSTADVQVPHPHSFPSPYFTITDHGVHTHHIAGAGHWSLLARPATWALIRRICTRACEQ